MIAVQCCQWTWWGSTLKVRSYYATICVALPHCTRLHRNYDVTALRCRMKVKFILTWNAVKLRWLAAESNRYISTATQLQCSMNRTFTVVGTKIICSMHLGFQHQQFLKQDIFCPICGLWYYSGIFYFCQYLHMGVGILSFGGYVFRL